MKTVRLQITLMLTFCLSFAVINNVGAVLPPGSPAADWTATDLNGNVHNMYDILNLGKPVVLEFSATWCGPCWNFHNTGTMETLYDTYGPPGTNQIEVFYIEADYGTNTDCLYGLATCNSSTQGDWVTGHDFPFIDLTSSNGNGMDDDYNVTYYPTVYGVSPNGNFGVYEIGQQTNISVWDTWLFQSFEMQVSATVQDATCPGEGFINLNVTGGYGGLNYAWNTGQNTASISGLEAGTYEVTVTDVNGYFDVSTYEVTGPPDPLSVETLAYTDVLCNGENTGAISVDANGGNGGYTFQWSNGVTGPFNDGLPAGTYEVLVTDIEGCTYTEMYEVTEPPLLTLLSFPEDVPCDDNTGSVIGVANGGVNPVLYDFGEGANYNGVFQNVLPGDYIMTVTDGNGCQEFSFFTVGETVPPEAETSTTEELDCNTSEITVSGAGSSTGTNISYQWTTPDGQIEGDNNTLDIVVSSEGTYTLEVIDNDTDCSEFSSILVELVAEAPQNEISTPDIITCETTSLVLDASGSSEGDEFTYQWTTEDGNIVEGATTLMPTIDAEGTYTLLISNSDNGCTTESSVTVDENTEAPVIETAGAELDCSVTEVELCAAVEEGVTVRWDTPEGVVEENCITVTSAGTYMATATGENGCEASAESIVTLSDDLPQVEIANPETLTCTNTLVTLAATLDGDEADHTITWTLPNGDEVNDEGLDLDVEEPGTYSLVVVNNDNGCTTSSSVMVDEVIIEPEAGFSSELVDGVLIFTNASSGDPSTFDWSFGSTDENTETTFDENGTYSVCLTVTNDCGESTTCMDVEYVTQLTFDTETVNNQCNGDDSGRIEVTPTGGLPGYTISWTGPNGFTADELTIEGLAAGEYVMVINDSYGYEKTASYTLTQPEALVANSSINQPLCYDEFGGIAVVVTGGVGTLTYQWSNGSTDSEVSDLEPGNYDVQITDENGCTITETYEIEETTEIIQNLVEITDATNDESNGIIMLDVEGGTGELTYLWSNGSTDQNLVDVPAGEYSVVVTDENGCSTTFGPFTVMNSVGVNELDFVTDMSIYPIPAHNYLNVDIKLHEATQTQLRVIDVYGKVVFSNDFYGKEIRTQIDVTDMTSGIYYIDFGTGTNRSLEKFIVLK